jgi:hypothetical protein
VAVAMQLLNPNSTHSGTLGSANLPSGGVNASFSGAAELPPRLLILTQQGGALVVDVEGFQVKSAGFFTVKVSAILLCWCRVLWYGSAQWGIHIKSLAFITALRMHDAGGRGAPDSARAGRHKRRGLASTGSRQQALGHYS